MRALQIARRHVIDDGEAEDVVERVLGADVAAFLAYDEGKLDLDKPISAYLAKPLPEYKAYADLADDTRWKSITPRMLMTHSAGFPNFRWLNPDEKLATPSAPPVEPKA